MTSNDADVDFVQSFRILWNDRILIAVVSSVVFLITLGWAYSMPNIYRAEVLLAPTESQNSSSLAALAGQYSGLANLAGISLGAENGDKVTLGVEIIRSRHFAAGFVSSGNRLVELMAIDKFDAGSAILLIDVDKFDVETGKWVRDVDPPKRPKPSVQEAYEELSERLRVRRDNDTGFIRISIDHESPVVAKKWVDALVLEVNDLMLRRDVEQAEQAIKYLNSQIASTSRAELRSVFFGLIEEQTKTLMLTKVSPEYVFQTIDPAIVPEEKHGPARLTMSAIALFLGFVMACLFSLVRSFVGRSAS